jgi:hypothetical protein
MKFTEQRADEIREILDNNRTRRDIVRAIVENEKELIYQMAVEFFDMYKNAGMDVQECLKLALENRGIA